MRVELELFADFFQFHLQDHDAEGDLSGAWSPAAAERQLAVAPGVLGVGTSRNVRVPVVIEVARNAPTESFDDYDLVNEATLDVPSGRIVVAGPTDYLPDARRIAVAPGTYRARVFYRNLDRVSANKLEGTDSYRVLLWPTHDRTEPRTVHDRRKRP